MYALYLKMLLILLWFIFRFSDKFLLMFFVMLVFCKPLSSLCISTLILFHFVDAKQFSQ